MSAPFLVRRFDDDATRNLVPPPLSPLPRPDLADTVKVDLPPRVGILLDDTAVLDLGAVQPIGVMATAVAVAESGGPGRHRAAPTWWTPLADALAIALARIGGAL